VYVTIDNGTQTLGSVGSGVCTHKGNGLHNYAPSQDETNGSSIQFTFLGTGAVSQTLQFETLPSTGVLAPTVANRTLDISAGGEAGIDLANVGSPTTTLNLSGLTIKNSTDVKMIVDLIYAVVQLTDASVSTMSVDTRNAILNRVLAGNHTTSGTVGLLLQFLDALISSRLAPATAGRPLTVSADGKVNAVLDSATAAQVDNIENASGYLLAIQAGACTDPQTASETYTITIFGSTFTVDMAGQTSTGTRTAPTLTKV
jgi:hypothetical protein